MELLDLKIKHSGHYFEKYYPDLFETYTNPSKKVLCIFPDHKDKHPSFRLIKDKFTDEIKCICTCMENKKAPDILSVIMAIEGVNFTKAKEMFMQFCTNEYGTFSLDKQVKSDTSGQPANQKNKPDNNDNKAYSLTEVLNWNIILSEDTKYRKRYYHYKSNYKIIGTEFRKKTNSEDERKSLFYYTDNKGMYKKGLKGLDTWYNQDDIRGRNKIIICEGCKDAYNVKLILNDENYAVISRRTTLTSVMSEMLKNKKVFCFFDNDKAGIAKLKENEKALNGICEAFYVVDLSNKWKDLFKESLPKKADITDLLIKIEDCNKDKTEDDLMAYQKENILSLISDSMAEIQTEIAKESTQINNVIDDSSQVDDDSDSAPLDSYYNMPEFQKEIRNKNNDNLLVNTHLDVRNINKEVEAKEDNKAVNEAEQGQNKPEVDDGIGKRKAMNDCIKEGAQQPENDALFLNMIFKNETTILFGDTGKGKSTLAMNIADYISRGRYITGFNNGQWDYRLSKPLKVLYADFELSEKQISNRSKQNDEFYFYSELFDRFSLKEDMENYYNGNKSFEDNVFDAISKELTKDDEVLIIDNITYLLTEAEKSKDAGNLLKKLKQLRRKYNLTLLILGHTPKKPKETTLQLNDMAGSKYFVNFTDSVFALGEVNSSPNQRYIVHLKSRSSEVKYHGKNVILIEMVKNETLKFNPLSCNIEYDLITVDEKAKLNNKVTELFKLGMSYSEIQKETGISKSTVSRIVKNKVK